MIPLEGRSGNLGRAKPVRFREVKWEDNCNLQLSKFTWTFKWNKQIHVISSSSFARGLSCPLYFSGVKVLTRRWVGEQDLLVVLWWWLGFFNGSSKNDIMMDSILHASHFSDLGIMGLYQMLPKMITFI